MQSNSEITESRMRKQTIHLLFTFVQVAIKFVRRKFVKEFVEVTKYKNYRLSSFFRLT